MDQNELYECAECGLHYRDKETAQQCGDWCLKNQSCNLEITRLSVERSGAKAKPQKTIPPA